MLKRRVSDNSLRTLVVVLVILIAVLVIAFIFALFASKSHAMTRHRAFDLAKRAVPVASGGYLNVGRITTSCYRGRYSRVRWQVIGKTIGEVKLNQFGWCGRGRSITHDFGWHGSSGSWGPWCIADFNVADGWDIFPHSKHGKVSGSLGVRTPFGCAGVNSGQAGLRIFADGFADFVIDF